MRKTLLLAFLSLSSLWSTPAHAGAALKESQAFEAAVQAGKPQAAPVTDGAAEGRLGNSSMRRANRTAAEILKQQMREQRPDDLKTLAEAGSAMVPGESTRLRAHAAVLSRQGAHADARRAMDAALAALAAENMGGAAPLLQRMTRESVG